ncbi:MAG: NmrA family NAD(P)-binding protein [Chloroflexi bacterium]|nr:NmrA family NAD(P)-binding protein [Chloroflexota bacterium]
MILVTGAGGKTGRALLAALAGRGLPARAFVRSAEQAASAHAAGAVETVTGDLMNPGNLARACAGCNQLYLICPNMHPAEESIGRAVIRAAQAAGVQKFVYHSVLHPQLEAMPHHWSKLRVEALVFESSLPFAILQPCAYMQNTLSQVEAIAAAGFMEVPYNLETRHSLVDLADVAAAAAEILASGAYTDGIYELAGPQALNQHDIAAALSAALGRPIAARQLPPKTWAARNPGLPEYARASLLAMFRHYDRHGLRGSPAVLAAILGRPPATFAQAAARLYG